MPLPTDDPNLRQPDISLAREALGWEPAVSLAEGLERTIEYFRALAGRGALRTPPVLTESREVEEERR